jgi:hypothetical protein
MKENKYKMITRKERKEIEDRAWFLRVVASSSPLQL